ncbi:MAG: DUF6958 family protein [Phycisphaerales bacterium]
MPRSTTARTETDEMIETKTVTPGKNGTRLSRAKYDAVRAALLEVIPKSESGVPFGDLPKQVAKRIPKSMQPANGSASWLTTTVKLDLEARGLIERVPGASPQRLRRVK